MFPDDTYVSLGVSPDATAMVLQPVIPGGYATFFPMRASLAELESHGNADAVARLGRITLGSMRAFYPLINVFADNLIPQFNGNPLAAHVQDQSGNIRAPHLRIHFNNTSRSIVVRRFTGDTCVGQHTPPMTLEQLMELGPHGASNYVGRTVWRELLALHPAVFTPFRALNSM